MTGAQPRRASTAKARGFTLLEVIVAATIAGILSAVTYTGFAAVRHEQANQRAATTLLSVTLVQRAAAANTGTFLSAPADVQPLTPNVTVRAGDQPADHDQQVSMRVDSDGVWLASAGHTCLATRLRPIDENMVAETVDMTGRQCSGDAAAGSP